MMPFMTDGGMVATFVIPTVDAHQALSHGLAEKKPS